MADRQSERWKVVDGDGDSGDDKHRGLENDGHREDDYDNDNNYNDNDTHDDHEDDDDQGDNGRSTVEKKRRQIFLFSLR